MRKSATNINDLINDENMLQSVREKSKFQYEQKNGKGDTLNSKAVKKLEEERPTHKNADFEHIAEETPKKKKSMDVVYKKHQLIIETPTKRSSFDFTNMKTNEEDLTESLGNTPTLTKKTRIRELRQRVAAPNQTEKIPDPPQSDDFGEFEEFNNMKELEK